MKIADIQKDQIEKKIAEILGVTHEEVTDEKILREDLGADSLHNVEIVMEVESILGITIPDDQAEHIRTVGDIFTLIARL